MQQDPYHLAPLLEPVVAQLGYELWGFEFNAGKQQAVLRVYIDSPEGITLDDCSKVSHQLSGVLDVEDPIKVAYALEISSPGLDRPLMKAEHFTRVTGQQVKIKTRFPVEGRRNFKGILRGLEEGQVVIEQDEARYTVPLDVIERARLVPEI